MLRSWPLDRAARVLRARRRHPARRSKKRPASSFPSPNRARDVRDGLVALARARGVDVSFDTSADVDSRRRASGWTLETTSRAARRRRASCSPPAGCRCRRPAATAPACSRRDGLGHVVHDTYPALTPLIAEPRRITPLSGVSLPVRLRAKWRGPHDRGVRRISVHASRLQRARRCSTSRTSRCAAAWTAAARATVRVQWSALDASEWEARLAGGAGLVVTARRARSAAAPRRTR